ncbi:unnamed protein product [Acanthoscelides obtectus]|uniref:Uncharacterized protein n=1 Tax=Acanthoscelides obtectus TaxID=200917 RepID=A0A9P0M2S9_ACAOB|nr:unnamed protein product [Acanthoscelides obtectus]CAK1662632.1 hypothetical protein AOBTE_LOCUS23244 [Acanthoscelides obtectus]
MRAAFLKVLRRRLGRRSALKFKGIQLGSVRGHLVYGWHGMYQRKRDILGALSSKHKLKK